ncbi:hypothetical protein OFC58_29765, partial [Escherichia coli]|nr:hypothetical protein [Escherichia coli]
MDTIDTVLQAHDEPHCEARRRWLRAAGAAALAGVVTRVRAEPPAVGKPLRLPDVPLVGGGRYGEAQARGKVLV